MKAVASRVRLATRLDAHLRILVKQNYLTQQKKARIICPVNKEELTMSVKIRLTRIGRHKDPFYRIVAADSHFTRDGRYIEQIGTYDPALGAAAAKIDEELALKWLNLGAQPSDSVRAMLSAKGIMTKYAESKKGNK